MFKCVSVLCFSRIPNFFNIKIKAVLMKTIKNAETTPKIMIPICIDRLNSPPLASSLASIAA